MLLEGGAECEDKIVEYCDYITTILPCNIPLLKVSDKDNSGEPVVHYPIWQFLSAVTEQEIKGSTVNIKQWSITITLPQYYHVAFIWCRS